MTSKYEVSKVYFTESFHLNFHKSSKWEDPHRLSKSDEFLFRKTELLEDEGIRLTFKLIHKEMDDDITLRITKYPDNSSWKTWKKIESEFTIRKVGRVGSPKAVSKRVLVLDVTRCTTFECPTCDEGDKLCYTDEHFCSFEMLKQALGDEISSATTLPVSFAGFLCSYGDYDKSKIMLPNSASTALLNRQDFSDITISADGREFCAHKAILAEDLSAPGLHALLNFIYTREIGDEVFTNVPLLLELLQTGDKYNIGALVDFCTEMIWLMPKEFFTPDNAIEIFVLSQQLRVRLLEEKAVLIFTAQEVLELAGAISIAFDKMHFQESNKKCLTKFLGIILSKFQRAR